MRTETIFCSLLLALEVLLAFQLPGVPVAGPAVGVFALLFLGTLSIGREIAGRLRYIHTFFLFLIAAAANRGSGEHVALAVIVGIHFFTWTEGLTATRRYAIKNGEPLPPDGRRAIYSLAFCAAVVLSYLFLDVPATQLPPSARSVLAFAAIVLGFCLWDIGYVTRLQRATRFRRPPVSVRIRAMQLLVIAAVIASLFLLFGRALPTSAYAIHEAAANFRAGTGSWVNDPTRDHGDAARRPIQADATDESPARIAGRDAAAETGAGDDPAASWLRRLRDLPWATITMVMLGCVFLGAFLISWRQRKREAAADGHDPALRFTHPNEEDPKYLREFYRLCERRFGVRKSRSETLLEFVHQLKRAGALRHEFDALCDYHYAVSYRDAPRDKQQETSFRETSRSFEAAIRLA